MTQASNSNSTTNVNLMASSTPIRIGSGSGSFHGPHTGSLSAGAVSASGSLTGGNQHHHQHHHSHQGTGTTGIGSDSPVGQVPTAVGQHLQLQSQTSLTSTGVSNQSISSSVAVGSGGAGGFVGSSLTPPSSAGLRQSSGVFDFKFMRRTSLRVLSPKFPSTDSLSNSPGPSSPGITHWGSDNRDKNDGNQTDKTPTDTSKLNRKESYKAQRKNYRREKKRVASELLNSLQDPAVIVLADWLKVRGTLKSWTKLWCVLKPGLLLLYKSPKTKSSHWVGTVLLSSCQVIERPSKKDGFCFKLFHPLEQSIWAPRGPDKETIGAVVQPLPTSYLIFRAPSQAAGKCWMDALELSLRCTALLLRSNSNSGVVQDVNIADTPQISHETQWSEADYEKHFNEQDLGLSTLRLSPYNELQKRYAQHLTVPEGDYSKSLGSSDVSINSRSQTPIFHQLYLTMQNWERLVASKSEFQKIKSFKKLYKTKHSDGAGVSMSSAGDLSDASSADDSPKKFLKAQVPSHRSLMLKKRRLCQLTKSISLNSALNRSSSSEEAMEAVEKNLTKSARPISAPPGVLQPFILNVKDFDADSQNEGANAIMSGADTDSDSEAPEHEVEAEGGTSKDVVDLAETPYIPLAEGEFGQTGEQVEELAEENKSLIWCLVKQVRPGMDLSKVVLPTFILEPRSFLDKLSDSYYHADLLSRAVIEDDPFTRMKTVVQWYLSGFYKKPKGLKKPYNPILGETFRCYWEHPGGSRTFYIAEQVSHHPPVSAFYVTNRQDGFCISCSILAKSKFYGNSTSAVLDGVATLTLLPRGESYTLTTPYAHCKGILLGTLSMELGGKINIECENTGYRTELEFKLKPFLGGSDNTNVVVGKIKLGKETLATINGHWDTEMRIKETKTNEETVLFAINRETKSKRLMRYVVPLDAQLPNESERLWQHVSDAIKRDDQIAATQEKTVLEEEQRRAAKERKANFIEWVPHHFQQDLLAGEWIYKYADLRPWDPRNDLKQYEAEYKVLTKTRHEAPLVRTASVVSSDILKVKRRNKSLVKLTSDVMPSDSSQSNDDNIIHKSISSHSMKRLMTAIDQMNKALDAHTLQLNQIHAKLERMQYAPARSTTTVTSSDSLRRWALNSVQSGSMLMSAVMYTLVGLFVVYILKWLLK